MEGMTVGLHTTPRGATPVLDADKVILDEDPIPGVLPTLVPPGDILIDLNLCPDPVEGADLILTAEPNPDRDLTEGIAVILGVATVQDLRPQAIQARRTDNLLSKPSNAEPIIEARQL